MKKFLAAGLVAVVVAVVSAGTGAQEMQTRAGVVTSITTLQQAPAQQASATTSRTGGAFGRALSRMAGNAVARATGDYQIASEAGNIANGVGQDLTSARATAAAGSAAYLVFVRFGDGTESAIQTSAGNLAVGSRVRVIGAGSAAQVFAE